MQTAEVQPEPSYAGSIDEQRIASEVFNAMRSMGRFFSKSAPIRASVDSLGGYFAAREPSKSSGDWSAEIEQVLRLNAGVFELEDVNGVLVVATTHQGIAPGLVETQDSQHTLANRFMEPRPVRPRPVAAARDSVLPMEPVAPLEPTFDDTPDVAFLEQPVGEKVAESVEPEDGEDELATPAEVAVDTELIEIDEANDVMLGQAIELRLRQELSVANFGDLWMSEDKVERLSRGDLRKIHQYLIERNQPLTDDVLLQDVLGVRPGADNYELMQFAANFRLSREPREFEFVGTPGQRLWTTNGLPSIGTTKRKPSEIGQDYRFLLAERPDEIDRSETVAEHVLTFYEYQYGVLPLNAVFEGLFPAPMLPDQRAAVLAFESPQNYETFFVELRYPTGNRGGYVAGLERFFLENLVPGALITIEQGENDGRYLIEFLPVSGLDRKLLQLDEKKSRYVFRPMTFYCATQDEMLLTENRFPHLANVAPLDERTRRRPELVLAATFERIGEQVGTGGTRRYMALLDDLAAAANVERPMSADLIRSIATSDQYPQFSVDPDVQDVFYYEPATE